MATRKRAQAAPADNDPGTEQAVKAIRHPSKLARALGDRGVVDEGRFDALAGWESLPFARPTRLPANAPWRVAVKVIDPRGNEGLRVLTMAST